MSKQKHIGQPITTSIKGIFSGAEIKQLDVGIFIIRMEFKTYTYNVGPGSSYKWIFFFHPEKVVFKWGYRGYNPTYRLQAGVINYNFIWASL